MKKFIAAVLLLLSPVAVQAKDITTTASLVTERSVLSPGDYSWNNDVSAQTITYIQVNLDTQMAYAFRGSNLVGVTSISSGRTGFETPTGSFTIKGKETNHRSKKYDADMPFTMWINDDGVALHGGSTPGRRSSHGCVHLPLGFAQRLFPLVRNQTKVVINASFDRNLVLSL